MTQYSNEHTHSYYAASANGLTPRPTLTSDLTADVCVIGGGLAGAPAGATAAS